MCALEVGGAAGRLAARLAFWRNQNATLLLPLSLFLSKPKYRIWSPLSGSMYWAAYAFMMSILLLTLLSRLHCQPVMSRVSLDPVAKVELSRVQNVVPAPSSQVPLRPTLLRKSRSKAPSLKPVVASKSMTSVGLPSALNRLSQSYGGSPGVFCEIAGSVSPSSWKSWSWMAMAVPAATISPVITVSAAIAASGRRPRRFGVTARLNTMASSPYMNSSLPMSPGPWAAAISGPNPLTGRINS